MKKSLHPVHSRANKERGRTGNKFLLNSLKEWMPTLMAVTSLLTKREVNTKGRLSPYNENNSSGNNNNNTTRNNILEREMIIYSVQRDASANEGSSSSDCSRHVCMCLHLDEGPELQIRDGNKNIRRDMRKKNTMSCWALSVMSLLLELLLILW